MRKDWEYKKLGECTNIEYGTRVVQKKDGGTIYPVYGGGGETFRIDKYNRENCLIIARFAMSKCCVRYVNGRFFLNDSGLSVKASNYFHQDFLNHCMVSLNDTIYNLGKGAAQRNLDIKAFKQIPIPIPPKPTQLAIVAELDKINELIQLKKQQLKDYDQLAQSIFYEMFGDPVENEKGWEKSELKNNVKEMFLGPFGSSLKIDSYVPKEISYCMVYEQKHAIKGNIHLDNHYITEEKYNSLKRFTILPGDFIMSCRGTIGKLYQLPPNAPLGIIHPSLMKIRIRDEKYNATFFKFLLIPIIANEQTNGNCVQMAITAKALGNKKIPLPPLPLQQQFAARIEAIERQKQQVSETIKDLETLLASRMQYWFD